MNIKYPDNEGAYIEGTEVLRILFFDDKKTFRIYYKDGLVTDGEII